MTTLMRTRWPADPASWASWHLKEHQTPETRKNFVEPRLDWTIGSTLPSVKLELAALCPRLAFLKFDDWDSDISEITP